jgi:hypothetical protein
MCKESRELCEEWPEGEFIPLIYKKPSVGSQPMLATWWMWMTETADFMAGNGCKMPLIIRPDGTWEGERPFDKNDAHEYFTRKWLGVDTMGVRYSWSRDKKHPERPVADTGQRLHAMNQHDDYCSERGIPITHPVNSEYRELMERQNA